MRLVAAALAIVLARMACSNDALVRARGAANITSTSTSLALAAVYTALYYGR